MSRHISDIRDALSEARRAYHDSTCWNESIEFDGSGPTYDQEIERAMVMAEARFAELEAMILRLVDDAHRMHMIGPGYRDAAQAMLYAEAKKLIGR